MLSLFSALFFAAIAGIVNGSYAFPVKYMNKWGQENTWLAFSLITFLIIPWLAIVFFVPNFSDIFHHVTKKTIMTLVFSGLSFGSGMILFSYALRYVGIGVAFMLEISVNTVCASLVPSLILNKDHLFDTFEILHDISLMLFVIGIIFASVAVNIKNNAIHANNKNPSIIGIMLGVSAGLLTSMQGISYAYAFPDMNKLHQRYDINLFITDNIPWAIIFLSAFIPYTLFFLKRVINKGLLQFYFKKITIKYWLFIILMGALYFSSLMFYTKSSELLGILGPAIAWPIMMSFIILSSNAWSYMQKEWLGCPQKCHLWTCISMLSVVSAVALLGLDYYYFGLK